MAIGAGKYGKECSSLQEQFKADGVILVVINGK
jgi:hypothetical protein